MSEREQQPTLSKKALSNLRILPQSDLDFNMLTTDPVWGKSEVSQGLKGKLSKYYKIEGAIEGDDQYSIESLWDLLGFFTRDIRLANLSSQPWNNEIGEVRYMLDLANDFLQEGMIESAVVCIERVASMTETSQGKGGFLRRQMNTFRQESTSQTLEPPKKKLFGADKKKEYG